MCKTPACECKSAGENLPDVNHASEDEDEFIDSDDSVYSDSSSDEGPSESDADSATGNRITPDMIVWYMLKEQGLITQEKYNEKADICEEQLKGMIPKIPKSEPSESSEDSVGEGEDLLAAFLENIACMREQNNAAQNADKNEGSQSEAAKETSDEAKENGPVVQENKTVSENKADNGNDATPQENSKENVETASPQENSKENVEIGNKQENDEVVEEMSEKEEIPGAKCPKCSKTSAISEAMPDNKQQNEDIDMDSENNKNLLNENIEPKQINETKHEDTSKDVKATETGDENENVDVKTEKISNQANTRQTKSFKFILKHLAKEKKISDEYEYIDVLETYVEDLDEQYKNNTATDLFDTHTDDLVQFAFFLNFYSPSSYKYILETFNTPLPEHKVLCSLYISDNERPGLSKRAFEILKRKANGKRLTCALMSRDIFMKNYGWDYDQVDYGGGCNFEYTDKAVMTFVFVLVSLEENWKMPIGYIYAKDIPAESQAELIRVCLTQCHESGIDVVAVTLDSPTPAEFLGCSFQDVKNLKTVFKHPVCESEVAVWIDPCLAIRSARHTLKVKGVLHDDSGNKIRWNLIRKLRNLYTAETIDFEQPKFLQLRNHIAKVGLTTEIFSESLVPALALCEELLPDTFGDTAPTKRYIEIVNSLYDVLNSKVTKDFKEIEELLTKGKDYMIALFCNRDNALSPFDKENIATDKRLEYRSFVEGKPACGFIGYLICIESYKHLHATLVQKEQILTSLNPHRLCKDHMENFVQSIRAFNSIDPEDFTGTAFQSFYDFLFDILENNPNFTDKNVPMEHWPMKNKYSPSVTIKRTSGKRVFDEVYSFQYIPKKLPKTTHGDQAIKLVQEYSKAMDAIMDVSTRKNMVAYLAGWIATKFAKCIKCEACIDSMCADKKRWFHKFITSKHSKGVCLPSEEIFKICWECERAVRTKTSPTRLLTYVLRRLSVRFPWGNTHSALHKVLLAKAIINKYIALRVPAPLAPREQQRVAAMFSVFNCMNKTGFFSELLRLGAEGNRQE